MSRAAKLKKYGVDEDNSMRSEFGWVCCLLYCIGSVQFIFVFEKIDFSQILCSSAIFAKNELLRSTTTARLRSNKQANLGLRIYLCYWDNVCWLSRPWAASATHSFGREWISKLGVLFPVGGDVAARPPRHHLWLLHSQRTYAGNLAKFYTYLHRRPQHSLDWKNERSLHTPQR